MNVREQALNVPDNKDSQNVEVLMKKHEDFDAIFFHQRSLDWDDIPDRWMNTFYTKDITWDVRCSPRPTVSTFQN